MIHFHSINLVLKETKQRTIGNNKTKTKKLKQSELNDKTQC